MSKRTSAIGLVECHIVQLKDVSRFHVKSSQWFVKVVCAAVRALSTSETESVTWIQCSSNRGRCRRPFRVRSYTQRAPSSANAHMRSDRFIRSMYHRV